MRFQPWSLLLSASLQHWASAMLPDQIPIARILHTGNTKPAAKLDMYTLPTVLSEELLYLHKSLVEIESISDHEGAVGEWLANYLMKKGFRVEKQEVAPNRYNVYAWIGNKGDAKVMVSSHIDTVPPFIPYSRTADGVIAGRGSVDAKGSVAAQIIAILSLMEGSGPAAIQSLPPIALLYVVGEESHGDGMKFFSESSLNRKDYDAVIFGEPTEGNLCGGHKGITLCKIRVQGRAAHSGYPWLGLSANDVLVQTLSKIKELEAHPGKDGFPNSEKYGNTTLNIGFVEGGVANNVVAEKAVSDIAIRIASANPQKIKEIVNSALAPLKTQTESQGGILDIEWPISGYGPVNMDCDVEGFNCITVNYGTDVPNLEVSKATKRYLYGPGTIMVAHGANEALTVKELKTAVLDYRRLIVKGWERNH